MADAKALRKPLGMFRRHKVLTTVGATAALVVALGIGSMGDGDAAAVAAVVEQTQTTSARITTAFENLRTTLEEAHAAADQEGGDADPAARATLLTAIEAAEATAATPVVTPTKDMSLEEAKTARAAAVALLAGLTSAGDEVRAASEAVNVAAGKAVAEKRAAEQAAAQKAAAEQAAAEQAAAEKAAADKAAADKAAADKASAEREAAEKAAADKASAEREAADDAAAVGGSSSSGEGKSSYANCADVWATIGRPILPTDPGYTSGRGKLDGNSDGVGCEERP